MKNGNTYTLDLGQVFSNGRTSSIAVCSFNIAALGSDSLRSSVSASVGAGFEVSDGQLPATIGAGNASDFSLQPGTTALGAQSETLTFTSDDVNTSGYSAALPDITLTVEDKVIAPAQATISTQTIDFSNVRVGTPESQTITVGNSAAKGAANLDVTMTAGSGTLASGSISQLAPGASDATDLSVGLATKVAGVQTGTVTLNLASDLGNGVEVAELPSPTVTLSGAVYREAAGQITPSHTIVHVGDPGSEALIIANTDPADGYSENPSLRLLASPGNLASVALVRPARSLLAQAMRRPLALRFRRRQQRFSRVRRQ